jgi:hypothetical protein
MTDKIEEQLASGIEDDMGIKAMAAKLAPRGPTALDGPPYRLTASSGSVEAKLQAIEKLVGEIRSISVQIKGQLG